jgi:NagD protein
MGAKIREERSLSKKAFLIDMDGVLLRGERAIPGAKEFIERLKEKGYKFLVLTNNSRYTPWDLKHRMKQAGIDIEAERFFSSAMAAAHFVSRQKPKGSAFVLGGTGLYQALNEVGYSFTDYQPDFVILGEMEHYPYDQVVRACQLIARGVPFIATNPDPSGPGEDGIVPACGAVAALIEKATGYAPYFVGKPNPLILRAALRYLGEHSENAVMVGDRMDTDVRVGLESGMETILVLTGVTKPEDIPRFPYRPTRIVNSVGEIELED